VTQRREAEGQRGRGAEVQRRSLSVSLSALSASVVNVLRMDKANPKKKVSTDDTDFHRYSRGNLCASVKSVDRQKS